MESILKHKRKKEKKKTMYQTQQMTTTATFSLETTSKKKKGSQIKADQKREKRGKKERKSDFLFQHKTKTNEIKGEQQRYKKSTNPIISVISVIVIIIIIIVVVVVVIVIVSNTCGAYCDCKNTNKNRQKMNIHKTHSKHPKSDDNKRKKTKEFESKN